MSLSSCDWQLSKPLKVPILERYVEAELQGPLSLEEQQERCSHVQRIRKLLTRSRYSCSSTAQIPWLPDSLDSFTTKWRPPASTATSHPHCWTSTAWTRFCSSRRRSWTCPTFWPLRHHGRADWWQVGGASRRPESTINLR